MSYIGKYIEIAKGVVIKVLFEKTNNNCKLVSRNGYEWYDVANRKTY